MNDLRRRLGRLEAMSGGAAGKAPDEEQWRAALETIQRYYKIWGTPKLVFDTLGIVPLSILRPEDRTFVEDCEAGALAAAEDVDERYRAVHGLTVDRAALKASIAEMLAEPLHAESSECPSDGRA